MPNEQFELVGQEPPPRKLTASDLDELFEARFWPIYPRKVAKRKAKALFVAIVTRGEATPEELITGAERYAAERAPQDPRFTKYPATWLNGGCWADEPAPPAPGPGAGKRQPNGLDYITERFGR